MLRPAALPAFQFHPNYAANDQVEEFFETSDGMEFYDKEDKDPKDPLVIYDEASLLLLGLSWNSSACMFA